MAHDILNMNPQGESQRYTFDFAPDLTGDTALNAIGAGSTITAYKYDGTDVSSSILSVKTVSSMTLFARSATSPRAKSTASSSPRKAARPP